MVEKLIESGEYDNNSVPKVILFDILAKDDKSLCHLPLRERKKFLAEIADGDLI